MGSCRCSSRSRGMPATGLAVLISRAKEEEEEEEEEKNEGDGSYYCHSEHRPQPSHRCQHPGSHGTRDNAVCCWVHIPMSATYQTGSHVGLSPFISSSPHSSWLLLF
ncbi:unnamed protein product [Gadus morhua 'NCC']